MLSILAPSPRPLSPGRRSRTRCAVLLCSGRRVGCVVVCFIAPHRPTPCRIGYASAAAASVPTAEAKAKGSPLRCAGRRVRFAAASSRSLRGGCLRTAIPPNLRPPSTHPINDTSADGPRLARYQCGQSKWKGSGTPHGAACDWRSKRASKADGAGGESAGSKGL